MQEKSLWRERDAAVLYVVLSRALRWLEKPYSRSSSGFECDQHEFHDIVQVLMQESISAAALLLYSI